MILTEKEAISQLCCGSPRIAGHSYCDTSDCMAWRWYEPTPNKRVLMTIKECNEIGECWNSDCSYRPGPADDDLFWVVGDDGRIRCPRCGSIQAKRIEFPERRLGFCGLAGKPEVK